MYTPRGTCGVRLCPASHTPVPYLPAHASSWNLHCCVVPRAPLSRRSLSWPLSSDSSMAQPLAMTPGAPTISRYTPGSLANRRTCGTGLSKGAGWV